MPPPPLKARGLARHFRVGPVDVRAVNGVDLDLRPGESVALCGPSGCGKSTLLALLAGLDTPTSGRVLLDGRDLSRLDDRALSRVRNTAFGMVFQAFHLAPHLTARENIELPLVLAGMSRADRNDRAGRLLERVGLGDRARHRPHRLSGGERQRLAIARAVIHRPRVVLADEPTGQLDTATSESVLDLLDELRTEHGAALLLATHDRTVARRCGRRLDMLDGRLADGSSVGAPRP